MSNSSQLASITARFDRAADAYQTEHAGLYHSDGVPKYGPKDHPKMLEAARQKLEAAAEQARTDLQVLRDAANSHLAALDIDPLLQIVNDAERAELAAKMPIIRESAELEALDRATTQVRSITEHGSRIEQLLWLRYGVRRLESVRAAYVNGMAAALPTSFEEAESEIKRTQARAHVNPDARVDVIAFDNAMKDLRRVATGDVEAKRKAARAAQADAGKAILRVNVRMSDLLRPNAMLVDVAKRF